jgi:hypothetical protein
MPRLGRIALALCTAGLAACATHREQDAPALFEAQPLQTNWWHTEFYGKNYASYRLRCIGPNGTGPARNELRVDLEYGSIREEWWRVETPDGVRLPERVIDKSFQRCQEFGSLQSMCIYEYSLAADIDSKTLAEGRTAGLTLTLHSKESGKHELPLSAVYIDDYLRACTASVAEPNKSRALPSDPAK